ncbi:MAG TPA: peptide synthetase, partial [Pseudonocardia sp.]|nr:peptide synthetase [Pseudonocardia sp.]
MVLCGAVQALSALAYAYLLATALALGFEWLNRAVDLWGTYLRALVFGAGALLVMCLIPILAKWVLIGRWKPGAIRVWSPAYLRFWCVKTLMRANPLVLFAGSPLYSVYLRLMGAKVGRGVVVYSPTFVCTDLLTIGDRTVIRKDALLPGYRAID